MQNFLLLKAVGQTNIPVALKRGSAATVDDSLNVAEYIAANGNQIFKSCSRTRNSDFDNQYTRNTFDFKTRFLSFKNYHTTQWSLIQVMRRGNGTW